MSPSQEPTPTAARPSVCLTFHFDALSIWLGTFGLATPQYVSRADFAANTATPRILDLLARNNVRSTWFVSGLDAESYPDAVRRIRDAGHEIAHHGYAHEDVGTLDEVREKAALERGLEALDTLLGVRPAGYRSPSYDLSQNSTRLLETYGFTWDSSLMGRDFEMYRARTGDQMSAADQISFGRETNLVEVPISWTLNDFMFMEFIMTPSLILPGSIDTKALGKRWRTDLDFCVRHVPHGIFTPIFHTQTIGRGSKLNLLEDLITRAQEHEAPFRTVSEAVATRPETSFTAEAGQHSPIPEDQP
jgi:peptidoglycan/xylan/chitin deacetylase (PgdA/CDA1 family)